MPVRCCALSRVLPALHPAAQRFSSLPGRQAATVLRGGPFFAADLPGGFYQALSLLSVSATTVPVMPPLTASSSKLWHGRNRLGGEAFTDGWLVGVASLDSLLGKLKSRIRLLGLHQVARAILRNSKNQKTGEKVVTAVGFEPTAY